MTELPALTADCSQCAALCCMALAFDKSASFAFDKPAGQPCRNLDRTGRCTIHDELETRGFGGCVRYDCLGAGQRVTRDVFGGRQWLKDRSLQLPMLRAFGVMHRVHSLIELLVATERLSLGEQDREKRSRLIAVLHPATGWTEESLADLPIETIAAEVREFLRSLKRYVTVE